MCPASDGGVVTVRTVFLWLGWVGLVLFDTHSQSQLQSQSVKFTECTVQYSTVQYITCVSRRPPLHLRTEANPSLPCRALPCSYDDEGLATLARAAGHHGPYSCLRPHRGQVWSARDQHRRQPACKRGSVWQTRPLLPHEHVQERYAESSPGRSTRPPTKLTSWCFFISHSHSTQPEW